MPEKLPGDNPRWARKYVSPALDFILREELKDEIAARMVVGGDHPQKQKYPQHKFSGFGEADKGVQVAYFCKTRDAQEAYNWEHAELISNELPEVRQTWVLLRSEYEAAGGVAQAAPPPLGDHTWTFMGASQRRMPEEYDALFVTVEHVYWDITQPLRAEVIDGDTGESRTVLRRVVPAGTSGQATDENGIQKEVQPMNFLWSWLSTRHAEGLKGRAVKGRAVRIVRGVDLAHWDAVLNYIAIITEHASDEDIYTPVVSYNVVPVWLCEDYNGSCKVTILERWTLAKPDFGGDPEWDTDSAPGSYPDIPEPTVILPRGITFNGRRLKVNVAPCLRQEYLFWDGGYSQRFQASEPMRWPASRVEYVKVFEDGGGYTTRWLIVDAPHIKGQSTGIDIKMNGEPTATTAEIEWTPQPTGGPSLTKLDVSTDAEFEGGFLPGFRDKTVTPPTNTPPLRTTITGMVRGQLYYVRIRRGGLTSNTLAIAGLPQAELTLAKQGQAVLTGATLSFGAVSVGEQGVVSLTLQSVGLKTVNELSATLSGADAGLFGLAALPDVMAPGNVVEWQIRFDPLSTGTKTATLELASNAPDSPLVLTLTGIGAAAELQLEQPAGTPVASGGTVAFGTVTTGSVSKTFKVRNVGNAPLRDLAVSITGTNPADWTVTTPLTSDEIAAGGFQYIVVRFDPVESEDAFGARTALLSIASNDSDENPHLITLTGTSASPTAPGMVDGMFDPAVNGTVKAMALQGDGKIIIGGSFTSVNATTRNRLARVNVDGTLDAFDPNADGAVNCVALQADGKVIVGGEFASIVATARNRIARVNADGTLDAFDPNADGIVNCLALQADGKVIVGGEFANIGGGAKPWLARLNADGTLDTGFTSEVSGPVYGVTLNEAGKIVIVGDWPLALTPSPTPSPTPTPGTTPPPSTPPPTASDSPSPPVPTPSTTSSNAPTPSTTNSDAMSPPPTPSTTSSDVMSPPPPTASNSPSPPPPTPSTTSSDVMSPPPTASDSPSPP